MRLRKKNISWHQKNPKPKGGGLEKLVKWHVDHQRECGCKPVPKIIQQKLAQRKPKLVVSVLVKNGSKYLLVKERMESGDYMWIVPGGKVEFGESLENAAKREIKEETGLTVRNLKYICFKEAIFPQFNYHTVIFFYQANTNNNKIGKDIEGKVKEAGWFSKVQIQKLSLVESAHWLFEDLGFFR